MKQIYGRADSGFYCREAVEGYEEIDARFVICARKTARLVEELRQAEWKPSPKTDADVECELYLLNDSRIVEGRTEAGGRDETAALEHF